MVKVPSLKSSSRSLPSAAARQLGDGRLDAGEAQLVGVAHHRHHQAPVGGDRDADVVVVLVDDRGARGIGVVDLGVDRRVLLERLDRSLHEEAHEAELPPVLLDEGVLVLGADGLDRGEVHLVEGGQHGGGLLRLDQATGDGPAQRRHGHPLGAGAVVDRGSGRSRRLGAGRAADVVRGDAPPHAVPYRAEVDAGLRGDLAAAGRLRSLLGGRGCQAASDAGASLALRAAAGAASRASGAGRARRSMRWSSPPTSRPRPRRARARRRTPARAPRGRPCRSPLPSRTRRTGCNRRAA